VALVYFRRFECTRAFNRRAEKEAAAAAFAFSGVTMD
jgi:hypothetical protein